MNALTRIVKEEGVAGLFTGAGPTVVRAMALNMGMLASNDQAKEMLEDMGFAKGGQVGGGVQRSAAVAVVVVVFRSGPVWARRAPLGLCACSLGLRGPACVHCGLASAGVAWKVEGLCGALQRARWFFTRRELLRPALCSCAHAPPMMMQVVIMGGATIAGFFASACSLPFDYVKTQLQKQQPGPDGAAALPACPRPPLWPLLLAAGGLGAGSQRFVQ